METSKFEEVIKGIDSRFSIVQNPNRTGLANILFDNKNYDLPVASSTLIKDEVDHEYRYQFPNGMSARYWSQSEITARLQDFLKLFNEGKIEENY